MAECHSPDDESLPLIVSQGELPTEVSDSVTSKRNRSSPRSS